MILFFISLVSTHVYAQDLETIKAKQVDENSDLFENDIEKYKTNEFWGIWTMPIGYPFSTSELKSQKELSYNVKNLCDYDLNTAWIEGKPDNGNGVKFGFVIDFPENTAYAGAYQFFGQVNLFNGYCKSIKAWKENSRIKVLKAYYNDIPICYIELLDTWHFQYFDIAKFFKNKRDKKFMDAPYEIVDGDKLTFEIISVYPGSKYKDTALTEFMAEGAGN